eukprot:TRINITY_DN8358_c0_g1_i1.p1 TRINITY_DN8358_c0_g1~~TRINITY_DN8358_c0_g1_i1.p1  ORF type:complete len:228 (-),score=64.40 TRINITY_DN8358_c0_g1_i1:58-741(-)
MNKMNLPPPFHDTNQGTKRSRDVMEEDELSDEEQLKLQKRKLRKLARRMKKKSDLVVEHKVKPSGNILQLSRVDASQNEIAVNISKEPIPSQSLQIFEIEQPKRNSHLDNCITLEELENNRMPTEEIIKIKYFTKYEPGEPSNKLYIKNLASDVTEEDMQYIYGRYFPSKTIMQENMKIKLLKKGRLKGQCFITFPNRPLAKKALQETHGYILHEKPMVISFGRTDK